jgi:hypothetical protein
MLATSTMRSPLAVPLSLLLTASSALPLVKIACEDHPWAKRRATRNEKMLPVELPTVWP